MILSIPDFSGACVLVAGDVMLDRYLFGGTERISPEAPVPVVQVRETVNRAGGAANVAANLSSLGVDTTLIGVVGQDDEAAALKAVLEQQNVSCRFKAVANWPTTTKTRVQSRGQQLIRLDREEQDASGSAALTGYLKKALKTSSAVVLSDYGKGALGDVSAMIDLCRNANIPVFVDPKGSDFDKYRGATVLTPNQSEFESVVGTCKDEEELVERARVLLGELDLSKWLGMETEGRYEFANHWVIAGGFSPVARFWLLIATVGVTVGWLGWKVVTPYLRRITVLYAAREIERTTPALKGGLLNLVDLQHAGKKIPDHVRAAIEKRAAVELSQIDVDLAVDRRP
ncbi:MAG: hypothetical protein IIB74_00740, partial [Proteobacteria bacterium]|nr:hypothetical protein [Pseudomonadota bacterium]